MQVGASFKEKVALSVSDLDGIAVSLASGSHGSSLADAGNAVDRKMSAVLSYYLLGDHYSVIAKINMDADIQLVRIVHIVPRIPHQFVKIITIFKTAVCSLCPKQISFVYAVA